MHLFFSVVICTFERLYLILNVNGQIGSENCGLYGF